MEKITIKLGPEATKTKDLEILRGEVSKEIAIEIDEQKPPKRPIVSAVPLDVVIQKVYEVSQELLSAESILKISGGMILRGIFGLAYKKAESAIINLIKVNNRKKGNKFGAEVVIYNEVTDKIQTYRFICDNIHESEISIALEHIGSTITKLEQDNSLEYLNTIEVIMFKYKKDGAWEIIAIKFV